MRDAPAVQTNAEFAASDELFQMACKLAGLVPHRHSEGCYKGIPPKLVCHRPFLLRRQASKWQRKRGLAWKFRAAAQVELQKEFAAKLEGSAK